MDGRLTVIFEKAKHGDLQREDYGICLQNFGGAFYFIIVENEKKQLGERDGEESGNYLWCE